MKKTLGAILIVLAAVIAVGTFGARYTSDTAEAVFLQPTPGAISLAAGGGVMSETNPLRVNKLGATLTLAQLNPARMVTGNVRMDSQIDPVAPSNVERIRVMSSSSADSDIATVSLTNPWGSLASIRFRIRAGTETGSTTITINVNGYACRTGGGGYVTHLSPNTGQDPNVSPPTNCSSGTSVVTSVAINIPVWVGYGTAPSAHTISAINVEATSGDIEAIAPGGTITQFDASIEPNHSGEIPFIAKLGNGNLADATGNAAEPDRPYVATNFYSREFSYSLAGSTTEGNAAANNRVAAMLNLETEFVQVAGSGDYQPQAKISAPGGATLPEGTYNFVLTGRDAAPSGNSDTVNMQLEVAGLSLTAQETTGSPPRPFTKVTEANPLVALTVPGYTSLNYEIQNRHRSAGFELRSGYAKRDATEVTRIVPDSLTIADGSIGRINAFINNADDDAFNVDALRPGRTTVSYRIRGYVCAHDTTPNTFAAPTDATTAITPVLCPASHSMSVSDVVSVTVPVFVGWADAPSAHAIQAVNVEEGSGDLETVGGAVARFDASLQASHSGEVPLIAKRMDGSLADPGGTSTEPDRPYVYENFQGRDFRYSVAGAPDDDAAQARLNAQVAVLTRVETNFKLVGSGTTYQPEAVISIAGGGGQLLPEGTHTLVLTGRDHATGGNSDTALVRIEVTGITFFANDPASGTSTKVTEANPLVAYTIRRYGPSYQTANRHRTSSFALRDGIVRTDPTESTRVVPGSIAVADDAIVSVIDRSNPNRDNEAITLVGTKVGSTTVSYQIRGYVCRSGADPDAYVAPTDNTADTPSTCPAGHTMVVTGPTLVSIPIHVGYKAEVPAQHVINAAPDPLVQGGLNETPDRFVSTVQSSHTGELPLFAVRENGELIDTFTEEDPDVPLTRRTADRVQVDFQGRLFTYKLTGAIDSDSPSQEGRNNMLARALQVETVHFNTPASPDVWEPVARITAREGVTLPAGTFTLTLTGSDDAPGGKTATVPVVVTVTGANRAPVVSDEVPRETRGTGAAAMDVPVLELPATSEDRQQEADPDADEVRVLHDFTGYFSDPDNQLLSYSLRGAPAGIFRLVQGAKLIQVGDIEYDDIDADDDDNVHTPGVDGNGDGDFDDPGDTKPVLQYVFSVVATDGSADASIEITFPVSEGVIISDTADTDFDVDENNAAGHLLGRVAIRQNDAEATTGFTIVNNPVENPTLYVLYKDADGDIVARDSDDVASMEILDAATSDTVEVKTFEITAANDADAGVLGGQLRVPVAGALNHEKKASYTLTVLAGEFEENADRPSATVTIAVNDVNETPVFGASFDEEGAFMTPTTARSYSAMLNEGADIGDVLSVTAVGVSPAESISAADQDAGQTATLAYSLVEDADDDPATARTAFIGPFAINKNAAGMPVVSVTGELDTEARGSYDLFVRVTDSGGESADAALRIAVEGVNENPYFVTVGADCSPAEKLSALSVARRDENVAAGTVVARYKACDPDGDDIIFELRPALDSAQFTITGTRGAAGSGEATAVLSVSAAASLDYEAKASYTVEVEVTDNEGGQGQLLQQLDLNNLNDNAPVWQVNPSGAPNSLSVNENTLRGAALATYVATDADGDPITYTLSGADAAQYQLDADSGVLATLASLDADRGNLSDTVTVTADDSGSTLSGSSGSATVSVSISINNVDDSISSIRVRQANPVLGTHGDPNTALADRKTTLRASVPEAPTDLPATAGDAVTKFVSTGNARWGSALRLEVLAQSPDASCGNGNQCVFIDLEGDDSDDTLKLMAFRASDQDNKFIAAVMPVKESGDATLGDGGVYKHTDGSVARIEVEEEDTLRIKFGNLRDSVLIDNEAPEFTNFLPEHEASLDDDEVDYTFTITDAISGIPEPEDLPDGDGDDNYMSVVGLVSNGQCANVPADYAPGRGETDLRRGKSMVANANLFEGETLWCAGNAEIRRIQDDKDFDDVDNGYDVETTVVLAQNRISYVTFIACDAAGNCVAFDPDENDRAEAFAEITIDTQNPTILMARTGVAWDSSDNTYDDDRNFIQVIFNDISDLNPDTIEQDDFVVEGHTVTRVYWYDDPDDGEAGWDNAAGTDTRFDRGSAVYRAIAKTVFLELEEDLLPDATPDVSVVPNGIEDAAGNEQDDDEREADDWIAPAFTVQSITSPRETSRDNVLVGEDEKVTLTVTSDERISATKPLVDVNYVNAPAGCVDRDGVITRTGRNNVARDDCATSPRGASLNSVITKDGTNEWTIVVDKPSATGYYNVYIYGDDRSSQSNRGSEGVAPDKIGADFFEKDGDVNADDAVYFEGDVQLPKPRVVVSGVHAGDTEPEVEQKRPLFIEIDFTSTFSADCDPGDNLSDELNCGAESSEYAEDGFDAVTITKFELDGVDMTDSVKTTDDETFLVALDDVSIGDHEITIQAMDVAGNELKDELDVEFSVDERDPFTRRLNPGWNLMSLPGEPLDGDISAIFTADIEVRRVYTFNPSIPGGWQVALRETLDDEWQGDLTTITEKNGYWVLSDAIQDLEVDIPRAAGGALGSSTPKQPPVIPLYKGWNLIPVVDVTGDALDTDMSIDAETYLNSLDDGLDLARVLGFNTITNEWFTVLDPDTTARRSLRIGSGYWVFVRESASLVPGGTPR